ncbi:MAG: tetratricopeptide repeat protein [Phycisphaerales bacterium]|nr:tetratricopeptide repeat protein [Phycisphaerales bacterium]
MKSAWPVLVLAAGMFALVAGVVVGVATKPKPDLGSPLGRADRLIQDGEFQQALDVLNEEVLPLVGQKWVPSADRARYHLGLARSVYLGQRALGIREASNDETVRREYLAAEDFGAELTPEDVVRLCDVYVELGQEERALSRVMKLTGDASDQRRRILRRLVEHELAKARPEYDRAIQVLTTISGDADLSLEDRAWSLARETEIRLGQGYASEAVARLLQGIMRIEDAPAASLAELYALLGTGYFAMGEYDSARKQLERAATLLGNTEPMMARVEVYQAMCDQATGSTAEARDRYSAVAAWAQGMDWQVPAIFGLAETEGVLGRTEESIDAYADVVQALLAGRSHPLVQPERVADSLLHQAEDRLTAEDPRSALRFVLRVEELFSLEHVPPDVLRTLAVAHRMLADRMIADVLVPGLDSVRQIARLDPATRETVQRHFLAAGQYFSRHAAAVMLSDNEGYVQSLWSAALSYDMAGDYERAIASFREYIEGVPDDSSVPGREASRAEARFRMGRAYQARGEHKLAADVFEALIADGELGSEGEGVGQYAEESYVPLAQVYLADADGTNDAEARRLLAEAVMGGLGDEGSLYFHDALFELGALHHRAGEYLAAVERLTEALERYPEDPEAPVLRYRLADSLRQEAASIEQTLARDAMPDAQSSALEEAREGHLREAIALFERVRQELDAEDPGYMPESRRVALRNAYFFLGDCAFDLGDYDAAVQHYETARERYSQDPASLVAMVQIVNAYVAMGQIDRARAANERAKRFYAQLPEDAWNDPYLPMSRTDWERWLDSTAELYGFGG